MNKRREMIVSMIFLLLFVLLVVCAREKEEKKGPRVLHGVDNMPSAMPTEQQEYVQEQYKKFMSDRKNQKKENENNHPKGSSQSKGSQSNQQQYQQQQQQQSPPPPPKGISPRKLGLVRTPIDSNNEYPALTEQVILPSGEYWFGTQLEIAGKVVPTVRKDGADPRKKVSVKSFAIDVDCVTNRQFAAFTKATNYITEAELYGWSFVFQGQASQEIIAEVDSENGYGRVKNALHWLAVANASWHHPFGLDRSIFDTNEMLDHPVIQVSHTDAVEYCAWAGEGKSIAQGGLRLPTEKEWEYAARGGRINESYPWGDDLDVTKMNIWTGEFPTLNDMADGYEGIAPIKSFPSNDYGLYNMLGNVWEWVSGGKASERVLRGGSFIDSKDGSFNHLVMVSTRQKNSGDSAGSNIGFRCARSIPEHHKEDKIHQSRNNNKEEDESTEHIEL